MGPRTGALVANPACQAQNQAAHHAADNVTDMRKQSLVKMRLSRSWSRVRDRVHFLQQPWVRPDCPLSENDKRPGEYVGAFHRDRYGQGLVCMGQVIARPGDDSLAAVNIHGIVDAMAIVLRELVLENG